MISTMSSPDLNNDAALRPKTLAEYVGQDKLKDKLGRGGR